MSLERDQCLCHTLRIHVSGSVCVTHYTYMSVFVSILLACYLIVAQEVARHRDTPKFCIRIYPAAWYTVETSSTVCQFTVISFASNCDKYQPWSIRPSLELPVRVISSISWRIPYNPSSRHPLYVWLEVPDSDVSILIHSRDILYCSPAFSFLICCLIMTSTSHYPIRYSPSKQLQLIGATLVEGT